MVVGDWRIYVEFLVLKFYLYYLWIFQVGGFGFKSGGIGENFVVCFRFFKDREGGLYVFGRMRLVFGYIWMC